MNYGLYTFFVRRCFTVMVTVMVIVMGVVIVMVIVIVMMVVIVMALVVAMVVIMVVVIAIVRVTHGHVLRRLAQAGKRGRKTLLSRAIMAR